MGLGIGGVETVLWISNRRSGGRAALHSSTIASRSLDGDEDELKIALTRPGAQKKYFCRFCIWVYLHVGRTFYIHMYLLCK